MNRNPTKLRKRMRGSLKLVAVLLVASAFARFTSNAGQALALNMGEANSNEQTTTTGQSVQASEEGLHKMLISLQKREADLAEKEQQMRARMGVLKRVDEDISQKLIEMQRAEERLRATLAISDTAAEDDIERLTQVYENMKPKDAAALFEEMDANFAAGFLGRMRPDAAAAIMAGLSSEAANLYSVILAGRNANALRK